MQIKEGRSDYGLHQTYIDSTGFSSWECSSHTVTTGANWHEQITELPKQDSTFNWSHHLKTFALLQKLSHRRGKEEL
jgi:hypothetical protein